MCQTVDCLTIYTLAWSLNSREAKPVKDVCFEGHNQLRQVLRWGYSAAFVACALNLVWLACLIFLQGIGDVAAQARMYPGIFRLGVGAALVLTVLQVPILLALTTLAFKRFPARAAIGGVLYVIYIPINLIAYFLYGRLAPIVHSSSSGADSAALLVANLIEIGQPLGLTGALPLLGYAILGLAWCLLSSSLVGLGRLWRVAGVLLFASGFLSVLGGIGTFIDVEWLGLCCLVGGVVSLPALAMTGVALASIDRSTKIQ